MRNICFIHKKVFVESNARKISNILLIKKYQWEIVYEKYSFLPLKDIRGKQCTVNI